MFPILKVVALTSGWLFLWRRFLVIAWETQSIQYTEYWKPQYHVMFYMLDIKETTQPDVKETTIV